jgi:hypothetical protein
MGATGVAILDFGAFPGASDASVAVTGQAAIVTGSLMEAWIRPVATADHSVDEHLVETLKVIAHSIVAGTGFTISGFNTNQIQEPLEAPGVGRTMTTSPTAGQNTGQQPAWPGSVGGMGTRLYGQFTVSWAWN